MGAAVKSRTSTPKKAIAKASTAKKDLRQNASILTFFKKAEVEETLFVGQHFAANQPSQPDVAPRDDGGIYEAEDDDGEGRYNEVEAAVKRRKTSSDADKHAVTTESLAVQDEAISAQTPITKSTRQKGPFLEDSESDGEDDGPVSDAKSENLTSVATKDSSPPAIELAANQLAHRESTDVSRGDVRTLEAEDSIDVEFENLEQFADVGDLGDDEMVGEEYREMRYMQEQARLEAEEAGNYSCDDALEPSFGTDSMVESCPICNGSLAGVGPDEATRHVNGCLDGDPVPLPQAEKAARIQENDVDGPEVGKRFAKAAVARPGQANPFSLSETGTSSGSAFAKLMSGHAEDAAWATAAAAEQLSRGKPAYQRTCPFYKIMPGFFICVDAFRYGKVEGCNAYFLSHFHSDHYVGLTANWSHGPIYCSRVTGDLVKCQLRTAAQWVKVLEFEETTEIPGTEGVTVTMIPANHCPGSSLFLFEKSRGKNQSAKVQRILHCGDFRACPAHTNHPLLKPEVVDAISGKSKQQKIDICYLDTTYLNPRYSFPPQEDVIKACADLCASMSPDPERPEDIWDRLGRESGSSSVSKFFSAVKTEDSEAQSSKGSNTGHRILVICGTYSIGKERVCKAIAQALKTKIYASPHKIKICSMLGDPELTALMTSNPVEAQVHMQMLMEIRAETLQDYLDSFKPHFSRIVGFRPSGWNYRPQGASKALNANTQPHAVATTQLLHGKAWRSRFTAKDFVAQRGSTKTAICFGVPYSEHSSFRELAMFTMALRIERVVPTVNVGSENSRRRMKAWTDRWLAERRKGGFVKLLEGDEDQGTDAVLWEGKDNRGGGAWW